MIHTITLECGVQTAVAGLWNSETFSHGVLNNGTFPVDGAGDPNYVVQESTIGELDIGGSLEEGDAMFGGKHILPRVLPRGSRRTDLVYDYGGPILEDEYLGLIESGVGARLRDRHTGDFEPVIAQLVERQAQLFAGYVRLINPVRIMRTFLASERGQGDDAEIVANCNDKLRPVRSYAAWLGSKGLAISTECRDLILDLSTTPDFVE